MKIARFFSVIFAALGSVLLVGTLVLCLTSLNKPVKLTDIPREAEERVEEMMRLLEAGDLSAAAKLMYGQPELGAKTAPEGELAALVWDAFLGSISYEFKGECYAADAGIYQDAAITVMDIPGVTQDLQLRAHALLTAKVEAAEDMAELYDEENNFRKELVEQVLQQAVEEAVAQNTKTVTRDVTLTLIQKDGQWWVVPDEALLQAISGGIA